MKAKRKPADPLRLDPTKTTDIRKRFAADIKRRFAKLRKIVRAGVLALSEGDLALQLVVHGGQGSGNFGHAGRPGEVGGSSGSGEKPIIKLWDNPGAPSTKTLMQLEKYYGIKADELDRVAALVGAQPGTLVELSPRDWHSESFVNVDVGDGKRWAATRFLCVDSDTGKKYIKNDVISIQKDYQGQGLGSEIFHGQILAAQKEGFAYIRCEAVRGEEGRTNGYYTWPRLGYDCVLADEMGLKNIAKIHEKFPGVERLSEVMETEEGRSWWKENGWTVYMNFDLTPGSKSMKIHEAYMAERAQRKPKNDTPTTNQEKTEEPDMAPWEEAALDAVWKSGIIANAEPFRTDPKRLKQFQTWLARQIDRNALTPEQLGEDVWTQAYAQEAYRRAHVQAYGKARRRAPGQKAAILYEGGQNEFLRVLGEPSAVDKVKYLASRAYDDLEGVTSRMATQMGRTMGDGMLKGLSADEIADNLVEDVGLEENRAITIARTEVVRAHAEGTLDAFEELGVSAVGVEVEWTTAANACKACQALAKVVIPVEAAHGLLPRHPNCRCSWLPAFGGEEGLRGEDAREAIRDSLDEGGDGWAGEDLLDDDEE